MLISLRPFIASLLVLNAAWTADGDVTISGELQQWHKVTLNLVGPQASELGTPNPFLDYRMEVTFTNGTYTYVVPGYFAADGNAGESSATAGNIWRAHLSPDVTGTWTYAVSFVVGADAAVSSQGKPLQPYHGIKGKITISDSDKKVPDLRAKGRLQYVGERYPRFAGNNEWFIKVGADSPENLLGYSDFDGTSYHGDKKKKLKDWKPHIGDWKKGDPSWQNGKGKGLIGALNYLASEELNVFSFLTYNAGGDGKDVWPYTAFNQRLTFDCSKLDQWEIVFSHGQKLGLFLHFKTQETENDDDKVYGLDQGELGKERKLYYRELIARFGHHLALNWNLGEENTQSTAALQAITKYFHDTDPYRHLVVLHTFPKKQEQVYRPLLGTASQLTGVSIQIGWNDVHQETLQWIAESTAAGKKWVVANDEQGGAQIGIPPDPGWPGYNQNTKPSQDQTRAGTLWGCYMAGGVGVECYFGYKTVETDLTLENFRSRDRWWDYCRHIRAFFVSYLPYWEMTNADALIGNAANTNDKYCFAKNGSIYAIYLPNGGTTAIDLSGASGTYTVHWFNPRDGGALVVGSQATITGGGSQFIGQSPQDPDKDWAVLIRKQ